jgi:hypothetical protein
MHRISLSAALVLALALALGADAALAAGSPGTPVRAAKTTPAAAQGKPSTERGIVQEVSEDGLVLRTLDGSTVAVTIDSGARVRVNHRLASLLDIRPGFVAVISRRGNAALTIEAFSAALAPVRGRPAVGAIRSVTNDTIVLAPSNGTTVTFAVDPATRIFVEGKPAAIRRLTPGYLVVVRPAAVPSRRTAYELDAFPPAHLSRGAIASVTTKAIVLRSPSGITTTIALTAATRIFLDGASASAAQLRSGLVAVVRTAPRREVFAFGRG